MLVLSLYIVLLRYTWKRYRSGLSALCSTHGSENLCLLRPTSTPMPKNNRPHRHRHIDSHPKESKRSALQKSKSQRRKPGDARLHPCTTSPKRVSVLELDLGAHLTAFLKKLPLNKLGRLTRLVERTSEKITPLRMVTAGLLLISQAHISLTVWAVLLGLLSGKTISKQGVFERLDQAAVDFFKAVLACALGQRVEQLQS